MSSQPGVVGGGGSGQPVPDAAAYISIAGFDVDSTLLDDDKVCAICANPAVPHMVLNCGHALCLTCSKRVETCPNCRERITSRAPYHVMTQLILSELVYTCRSDGCPFRGNHDAAQKHRCNTRALRFKQVFPQLSFAEVERALNDRPNAADDEIVTSLFSAVERQSSDASGGTPTDGGPAGRLPPQQFPSSGATASQLQSPSAPGQQPREEAALQKAALFWDLDNLHPKFLRVPVPVFFSKLLGYLRDRHGIRVRDSSAYLVHGKNYHELPEKLAALQIAMRLSSQKREAADREIAGDIRRLIEQTHPDAARRPVVLLSSDKDFVRDVKDLADAGHQVFVVHNAPRDSEHESILAMYPTAAIQLQDFLSPTTTSAAPPAAAAPHPPAGARGGAETPNSPPAAGADGGCGAGVELPETITVSGEVIPVRTLVRNRTLVNYALGALRNEPRFCNRLAEPTHDIITCPALHRVPATVTIEGEAVPTAHLINNKLVTWLFKHPGAEGRWCFGAPHHHDVAECTFAHCRPGYVCVEGRTYPDEALIGNAALQYLKQMPTRKGTLCSNRKPHDERACTFVHLVAQPSSPACGERDDAAAKGGSMASSPVPATVKVGPAKVPVDNLVMNAGLRHLIAHPNAKGKLCRIKDDAHDIAACMQLHSKLSAGQRAADNHASKRDDDGAATASGSASAPALAPDTRQPVPKADKADKPPPPPPPYQPNSGAARDPAAPPPPPPPPYHPPSELRRSAPPFAPPPSYTTAHATSPPPYAAAPPPPPPYSNAAVQHQPPVRGQPTVAPRTKPTHVQVEGVQVAVTELEPNVALTFLLAHPTSDGRWCKQTSLHTAGECSYMHRKASPHDEQPQPHEALQAGGRRLVLVEGERVSQNLIVDSPALRRILSGADVAGRWCPEASEPGHDPRRCERYLHRIVLGPRDDTAAVAASPAGLASPSYSAALSSTTSADASAGTSPVKRGLTVHVKGSGQVRVHTLLRNVALERLVTRKHLSGTWCSFGDNCRDPHTCGFIHKSSFAPPSDSSCDDDEDDSDSEARAQHHRPSSHVVVEGARVAVGEVERNPAVEHLLANPTQTGKWCKYQGSVGHKAAACTFVHRLQPAPPSQHTPPTLVVDGEAVPVSDIAANDAKAYLLQHPHQSGKWCTNTRDHDVVTCTFVHRAEEW